jgi:hypothetical protein
MPLKKPRHSVDEKKAEETVGEHVGMKKTTLTRSPQETVGADAFRITPFSMKLPRRKRVTSKSSDKSEINYTNQKLTFFRFLSRSTS